MNWHVVRGVYSLFLSLVRLQREETMVRPFLKTSSVHFFWIFTLLGLTRPPTRCSLPSSISWIIHRYRVRLWSPLYRTHWRCIRGFTCRFLMSCCETHKCGGSPASNTSCLIQTSKDMARRWSWGELNEACVLKQTIRTGTHLSIKAATLLILHKLIQNIMWTGFTSQPRRIISWLTINKLP